MSESDFYKVAPIKVVVCSCLLRIFYLARFPIFDDFYCRVRVPVTVVRLNNLGKKLHFSSDEKAGELELKGTLRKFA